MDQVSQSCDNYDLTISTKKTEVVHQPALGKPHNEPIITVNGQNLNIVDKFTLSGAIHINDEVTVRIAKASVAFGRPCKCLGAKWNRACHQAESLQGCGTANRFVCM